MLDWLAEQRFSFAEMQAAALQGQLRSLAADRELLHGEPISLEEAATASGLDVGLLIRVLRASGFMPDRVRLTTASIDLLRLFGLARVVFSEGEALHFTRVMGSSLARVADAANSLFLIDVEVPLRSRTDSELELAKQQLAATKLLDDVAGALSELFRLHVDDAVRRSRDARRGTGAVEVVSMAVGFVDLVGYTSFTQGITMPELLALVLDFESGAYGLVADHGGRVVKLIGDEVMYTAFDADAAAAIALALVAALRERGEVAPRGGLAYGEVLAHGGDCYGPVVNLASRISDVAAPWEILVTDDLAARVGDRFVFEPAGRRLLRGFDAPVVLQSLAAP